MGADFLACTEDAMIVFDASTSMTSASLFGSNGFSTSRIDEGRSALHKVLPQVTRSRRIGLITYGPGTPGQCNVKLNFEPLPQAANRILSTISSLVPDGRTPLTEGVEAAARILNYRFQPGTIVVVTDGEESCGRSPCELAKHLRASAKSMTIHVVALGYGYSWAAAHSGLDTPKCLSDYNHGHYLPVSREEELVESLQRALGCPMTAQNSGRGQ